MSDLLLPFEKQKCDFKLSVAVPPLGYIHKQHIADNFAVAVAVDIPYPVLKLWKSLHGSLTDEKGNTVDYIDLLNKFIPGEWFKVSRETGFRIQGRLRRAAGSVVSKYTGGKVGGRKREELNKKCFTLSILQQGLVAVDELEEDLHHAKEEVKEWKIKCQDLAKEMKEALERKEMEMRQGLDTLEEQNSELSDYIQKLEKKAGYLCHGKKFDQLGERQKTRRVQVLKERADVALWFLKSHGLELSFLKVQETETGKTHSFNFNESETCTDGPDNTDEENLETLLFLLDKFCASDELYHELTMVSDGLPRSYLIKQKRNELNKLCHIERIPGKLPGAQLSFSATLRDNIREFLESHPNHPINEPMQVKISGDSAKMSRTTNFMLLSFSILQTGDQVMSSKGNRTIGIVNGPEKYETLKVSFADLIMEINTVISKGTLDIDGKEIPIEMFLGGDYKFLLMAMGLSGATSDYACLWCKVHKLQRWDTSKPLDYCNTGDLKRTVQEIKEIHNTTKKLSCKNHPLFDIDLDHVILDELHLMMRITDRLTENLMQEVMERDSKHDSNAVRGQEKGVYLKRLVTTINSFGVSFSIWEKTNADGKGSGAYDWTSLVGSEKKKLMRQLPKKLQEMDILWPETKQTVVNLWTDFSSLYKMINCELIPDDNYYLEIFHKGKQFIDSFCSLSGKRVGFSKARVTPYMHALVYHVPMVFRNHRNLKQFTGQGVEKNNDDAKRIFYQKSNKWDAARDVLQLEARQQALQHCGREKRKYNKRCEEYWQDGIIETRKKRLRSKPTSPEENAQESDEQATNGTAICTYNNMNVQQLRQEVKSRNLNIRGVGRMKKADLLELLAQSN